MTKTQIKNFLVKKPSYLRWSTSRIMNRLKLTSYKFTEYNRFYSEVRQAKELAKKYIKKNGGKW